MVFQGWVIATQVVAPKDSMVQEVQVDLLHRIGAMDDEFMEELTSSRTANPGTRAIGEQHNAPFGNTG